MEVPWRCHRGRWFFDQLGTWNLLHAAEEEHCRSYAWNSLAPGPTSNKPGAPHRP
jgi:hypothetical protein